MMATWITPSGYFLVGQDYKETAYSATAWQKKQCGARCRTNPSPNYEIIYREQTNSLAAIPTILNPCKYLKNKYIFVSIVMGKGYRTKYKISKMANSEKSGDAKPRVLGHPMKG